MQQIKSFLKSKGQKEKTIKTYCSVIGRILSRLPKEFNEYDVETCLERMSLNPSTYNLYRTIFNFYTTKYRGFSITFTKAKVNKPLPTYVSREELKDVFDTIPNLKHKLGIALAYGSGLRVHEICRIKKHDINLSSQTLLVKEGKGGKERMTILPTKITHALESFIKTTNKDNPYLFQTYRGHISERSFQERLSKAIRDSKISKDFGMHDLRHSFAINLLNKKVDIETVRKLLGHNNLRTTQIYLQCMTIDLTALAKIA